MVVRLLELAMVVTVADCTGQVSSIPLSRPDWKREDQDALTISKQPNQSHLAPVLFNIMLIQNKSDEVVM